MKIRKKKEAPAKAPRTGSSRRQRGQYWKVDEAISPTMIPYLFWREWGKARDRGDYPFLFQLVADHGPAREHWGNDLDAFLEACRRGRSAIPGLAPADLFRIRLEGPAVAHLIQCRHHDERGATSFEAERFYMLRDEQKGWRVHQIDRIDVPREREPKSLRIEDFPPVGQPG
ncbi:MAG: hypothetical protein EA398_06230 [Deltaproteobacteria bacterium]|nr:MAG: hypothetical protein EA398_06230 [Deltaproteobacteria bacterium]